MQKTFREFRFWESVCMWTNWAKYPHGHSFLSLRVGGLASQLNPRFPSSTLGYFVFFYFTSWRPFFQLSIHIRFLTTPYNQPPYRSQLFFFFFASVQLITLFAFSNTLEHAFSHMRSPLAVPYLTLPPLPTSFINLKVFYSGQQERAR